MKIREHILSDFLVIAIIKNKHRDTVKDVHYLKTCHHRKRTADHVPITLHSSLVEHLGEKSSFCWKKAINSNQSKASFDIVNLLLRGEKVIQKMGALLIYKEFVSSGLISVLKRSHDYEDFSASWLTGDEWRVIRVIRVLSAVGYRRW